MSGVEGFPTGSQEANTQSVWELVYEVGQTALTVANELTAAKAQHVAEANLRGFGSYLRLWCVLEKLQQHADHVGPHLTDVDDTYMAQAHFEMLRRSVPLLPGEMRYFTHYLLTARKPLSDDDIVFRFGRMSPGLAERWHQWIEDEQREDLAGWSSPYAPGCEWTITACRGLYEYLTNDGESATGIPIRP